MSPSLPTIDVVTPLYNGGKTIGRLLDALLEQSRPARSIVVVDDGSTDGSPAIVERYAGVRLLRNPQKGANLARVFGLSQSDSPYVALIDQDDLPHPDHLAVLARALDEHANCSAVLGESMAIRDDRLVAAERPRFDPVPFDPWADFPVYTSESPSAALLRRRALEEIGGWCTRFVGVADTYAWLRLSERAPLLKNRSPTWGRGEVEGSYSRTMRLEGAEKYFRNRAAASADAMEHRIRLRPDEAARLQERIEVMDHVASLLRGIHLADHQAVRQAALDMERCLAREDAQFIAKTCQMLMWFLAMGLDQADPAQRQPVLTALVDVWPAQARLTGRTLRDAVARKLTADFQVRYLLAGPACRGRWQLMGQMIKSRVRKRIGMA